MIKRFFIFVCSLIAFGQALNSAWFNLQGERQSCQNSPAVTCEEKRLSPTPLERVLVYRAYTEVDFSQQKIQSTEDEDFRTEQIYSNFNLGLFFALPGANGLGLRINNPFPFASSTRMEDSLRLESMPPNVSASAWLGTNLLGYGKNEKHQLIFMVDLPLNYGPGLWQYQLEWVTQKMLRVRTHYSIRNARDELVDNSLEQSFYKYRYTQEKWLAGVGARVRQIDIAFWGEYELMSKSKIESALTQSGEGFYYGGSLDFGRQKWRWFNSCQWGQQQKEIFYTPGSNRGFVYYPYRERFFNYHAQLVHKLANRHRIILNGGNRWSLIKPDEVSVKLPQNQGASWMGMLPIDTLIQENDYMHWITTAGAAVRMSFGNFFVQPGWEYFLATRRGDPPMWNNWGQKVLYQSKWEQYNGNNIILELGADLPGNRYVYTLRHGFVRTQTDPYNLELETGTRHEFEIKSHF